MTIALVVLACVVSWVVAGAIATRWYADHISYCSESKSLTRRWCDLNHSKDCWGAKGQIGGAEVAAGIATGMVWPLALIPFTVYVLATRKPTKVGREVQFRENLRELGMDE